MDSVNNGTAPGGPPASLADMGWDAKWDADWRRRLEQFAEDGLCPARVMCEHREAYDLWSESGEVRAEVSGRFRHKHPVRSEWPAVGDWVAILARSVEETGTIHDVLPRRSWFSRKAAGDRCEEQVVAANVDIIFLVSGMDGDFNVRRIERYLTMAWESGARPVIVLNKADVCADAGGCVAEVESVAFGASVVVTSVPTGRGLDQLRAFLKPGTTGAFLGSSGVGKSSLVNALLGASRQATRAVRENDSRGRHTTTTRDLILLPGGGLVLDTPGMRELQLWTNDEGLAHSFSDIEELAKQCRFRDCTHSSEPGCAVQAALESGALDPGRYSSYRKMEREVRYFTLRRDQSARLIEKNRWKSIAREIRRIEKHKGNK